MGVSRSVLPVRVYERTARTHRLVEAEFKVGRGYKALYLSAPLFQHVADAENFCNVYGDPENCDYILVPAEAAH